MTSPTKLSVSLSTPTVSHRDLDERRLTAHSSYDALAILNSHRSCVMIRDIATSEYSDGGGA